MAANRLPASLHTMEPNSTLDPFILHNLVPLSASEHTPSPAPSTTSAVAPVHELSLVPSPSTVSTHILPPVTVSTLASCQSTIPAHDASIATVSSHGPSSSTVSTHTPSSVIASAHAPSPVTVSSHTLPPMMASAPIPLIAKVAAPIPLTPTVAAHDAATSTATAFVHTPSPITLSVRTPASVTDPVPIPSYAPDSSLTDQLLANVPAEVMDVLKHTLSRASLMMKGLIQELRGCYNELLDADGSDQKWKGCFLEGLTTCCYIIGIIHLVLWSNVCAALFVMVLNFRQTILSENYCWFYYPSLNFSLCWKSFFVNYVFRLLIPLAVCIAMVVCNGLLFRGLRKNRPGLLLPFLISNGVLVLIAFVYSLVMLGLLLFPHSRLSVRKDSVNLVMATCLTCFLSYSIFVVKACRTEMKHKADDVLQKENNEELYFSGEEKEALLEDSH